MKLGEAIFGFPLGALVAGIALTAAAALTGEVRRDGMKVIFRSCPECSARMRFDNDATRAYVNVERLSMPGMTTEELARRKLDMSERAFALMREAAALRRDHLARPIAQWVDLDKRWCVFPGPQLFGCDLWTLADDDFGLVTNPFLLVAGRPLGDGTKVVAVCNDTEEDDEIRIDFAEQGLAGKVAVFDLIERAEFGEWSDGYLAPVPAHGTRVFRLDAREGGRR